MKSHIWIVIVILLGIMLYLGLQTNNRLNIETPNVRIDNLGY